LNKEAIIEIKYGEGFESLCKKYGDYYLAGYRIGGDTGILMSASGHTREQIDEYGITASLTSRHSLLAVKRSCWDMTPLME
jgi:hypothetical protein